jgi:hypothetical protein
MITSSRIKLQDRASAVAIDDAEKYGKSMKMVVRVQNSGVKNATCFRNEHTEASVDWPHALNLPFLTTSRKIATSNSIGRNSIEAVPCLQTAGVTVDNINVVGLGL